MNTIEALLARTYQIEVARYERGGQHVIVHAYTRAQLEQVAAQVLEEAAKVCDERFALRASEGLPREASNARSLAAAIRALAVPAKEMP